MTVNSTQNLELTLKSANKKYPVLSEYDSEINARAVVKNAKKTRMDELLD